jgi:hypothetical protein
MRDPVKLQQAVECAHTVIWIRCSRPSRWAQKGQLLGIARATSDGALTATIWDVAVHPAWQRIGLGRALMERIVRSLCESKIEVISLYAEPAVIRLYEKLGFQKDMQVCPPRMCCTVLAFGRLPRALRGKAAPFSITRFCVCLHVNSSEGSVSSCHGR